MNPFRFSEPVSAPGDSCLVLRWIVACVALGIALNVLAVLARVAAAGTF